MTLFTLILLFFCTVVLGCAFLLPKNGKNDITASAATNQPTIEFGMARYLAAGASGSVLPDQNYSTLTETSLNGFSGYRATDGATGKISVTIAAPDGIVHRLVAVPMIIKVNVPAYTVYTYEFTAKVSRDATAHGKATLIYDTWRDASGGSYDVSLPLSTLSYNNQPSGWSGIIGDGNSSPADLSSGGLFYNDSSTQKELSVYSFYLAKIGDGCGRGCTSTFNLSINSTVTEVAKIPVSAVDGANTVTYDGTDKTFKYKYDIPTVSKYDTSVTYSTVYKTVKTTVEALDFDNNAIAASTYSLTETSSGGTLKAKLAGKYTVKFDLTNEAKAGGVEWDGGGTATKTLTYTINQAPLNIPTVTAQAPYSGTPQTFTMTGFDGTKMQVNSAVGSNSANTVTVNANVFTATEVDTYTATLSITDSNYCWNDTQRTGTRTINFRITKKKLGFTFVCSEAGAKWENGKQNVTITVTEDSVASDTVSLVFYYDTTATTLTGTTTGKQTVITMPANIPNGTHKLYAVLANSSADDANYDVDTTRNTFNFTVEAGAINLSDIKWTVNGTTDELPVNGELPFKLRTGSTTQGADYELTVKIPSTLNFVTVDTSKYNSGYKGDRKKSAVCASGTTYTVTVALISSDPAKQFTVNGSPSPTYDLVLNWKIVKGEFDVSGIKWEYSYTDSNGQRQTKDYNGAVEYEGTNIEVKIKASTLPAGLTLQSGYTYSDAQKNVDTYTATATRSDFDWNNANFNAPNDTDPAFTLSWEIKPRNLYTNFRNERVTYTKQDGTVVTYTTKVLQIDSRFVNFVKYEYYDSNGNPVTPTAIGEAVDPTTPKRYTVKAVIDSTAAGAANFEIDDNGSAPTATFTTGSNNDPAQVIIDGTAVDGTNVTSATAVYDGQPHFTQVTAESLTGMTVTDITVKYYAGTSLAGIALAAGDYPTDAGEYLVEVVLGSVAENNYILVQDVIKLTIEKKPIDLPTLEEITFSGSPINLVDYLTGFDNNLMEFVAGGDYEGIRDVSDTGYTVQIKLKDTNYRWAYPEAASTVKALMYGKTDYEVSSVDDSTAAYKWNIAPLVVDTSNMWSKGKDGASLKLPDNVQALISAGTLDVGYRYYDSEGNFIENPELKGGKQFKVDAVFGGDDSVRNVVFKTADGKIGSTAPAINYTVPKSGAATFFGNALSFFKSNWLWFLIGFLILLFLIILICVIVHRRKTKEEREAKKEAKEEEKRRKEEEREEEKRRREQERELEKAKAEAELAKMRAGLGLGAGAAGMAMAAQQQPVQQPVQQVQPVQQPQYQPQYPQYPVNELAELKADIRELKAQQRSGAYQQMPMMQMPMAMPMQMPNYGAQMPNGGGMGGGMNEVLITMLQNQLNEMRSGNSDKEIASLKTQLELMKLQPQAQPQTAVQPKAEIPARAESGEIEKFGAFAAALWRNMNAAPAPREIAQTAEESKPVSVAYPPDAVVTTTTTVDTTKPKPEVSRDSERNFDIDGFYDNFDPNKNSL